MYNVQFDAETHTYTVNGAAVPNVTTICAPLGADYDEPDDDLELTIEAAADRGLTLHAYLEHRLNGGDPDDFEMPSIYAGYAEAVDNFLAEHEITPYLIETPLGCANFAGTPDLIAGFDGDNTAIIDWKFVSQMAKSKIAGQIGGYENLCNENGIFPTCFYAVQFLKDGKYRIYEVDIVFARAAWNACRQIHDLKNCKHPRGKIGGNK